jgi:hypothetical protein
MATGACTVAAMFRGGAWSFFAPRETRPGAFPLHGSQLIVRAGPVGATVRAASGSQALHPINAVVCRAHVGRHSARLAASRKPPDTPVLSAAAERTRASEAPATGSQGSGGT